MIADEPTSALDVSVQARVLKLLRALQADHGFACLFISHDLAVIEELSDRIAVMQSGRLVESGPAETVLNHPTELHRPADRLGAGTRPGRTGPPA